MRISQVQKDVCILSKQTKQHCSKKPLLSKVLAEQ